MSSSLEMQNPAGGPGFAEMQNGISDISFLPNMDEASKGNSASAQRSRLLAALIKGPLSTLEARNRLDVLHPAARVQDTIRGTDITPEGSPHRIAFYRYRGKEDGAQ